MTIASLHRPNRSPIGVVTELTGLRQLFEDKIREDAVRGELFENLYRDLANYRDDQKIVALVRRGFRYRGRVLRPECVIIGRFNADREEENGYSNRD